MDGARFVESSRDMVITVSCHFALFFLFESSGFDRNRGMNVEEKLGLLVLPERRRDDVEGSGTNFDRKNDEAGPERGRTFPVLSRCCFSIKRKRGLSFSRQGTDLANFRIGKPEFAKSK